ncbi:MFS transporter [Reinekea thalattae]|uniref:MFS transporter n=1 Tax=Reinekea thalattae TaxID=2593301 RepID=A0A5C8Z5Q2_9GAMM|nr:MFS transporter [Reinekea thalattae]TXR53445.1 MFS transporter [Reinekea thalattae]
MKSYLMAPEKTPKREIISWALYDFANSSYTTVVITFVYSAFFMSYIIPPELAHLKNSLWAATISLSTLISIFAAPYIGALCDITGRKKQYLGVCTLTSVISTALLYFVGPNDLALGMFLLVISNTAWMLSESFNASFLTDISNEKNIGSVSGFGWGIGYIGGLLSLILVFMIITASAENNIQQYIHQNQLAMLMIALFYGIAALPLFFVVKQTPPTPLTKEGNKISSSQLLLLAWQQIRQLKSLSRDKPSMFQFFLAFLVYTAGVAVVVKFMGIYATEEIGISGAELIIVGATLQVSSMIGAILFGLLDDKVGSKAAILYSIALWVLGVCAIYFLASLSYWTNISMSQLFIVICFIAGSALGATQSSSRAIVGRFASGQDSAFIFGLWGTFSRLAIILAMLFGPLSDLVGRQNSLLLILVYFLIGAFLLIKVPVNKALNSH